MTVKNTPVTTIEIRSRSNRRRAILACAKSIDSGAGGSGGVTQSNSAGRRGALSHMQHESK
jgi:hypothetical protein